MSRPRLEVADIFDRHGAAWFALPAHYDDGGISGGTLERPALKRLLRDVEAGLIDVVVVYKIDRLSRSLTDFQAEAACRWRILHDLAGQVHFRAFSLTPLAIFG